MDIAEERSAFELLENISIHYMHTRTHVDTYTREPIINIHSHPQHTHTHTHTHTPTTHKHIQTHTHNKRTHLQHLAKGVRAK